MFYLIFLIKISKEKQMNITIRKATQEDFPAILSMIKELAEFEKAPEKVTNSIEQMKVEKDLFHCFLAENDGKEILEWPCTSLLILLGLVNLCTLTTCMLKKNTEEIKSEQLCSKKSLK
jgi:hypothetical protein